MNLSPLKQSQPVPASLAAVENLSPHFFALLAKLGLEVVIVRLDSAHDSPVYNYPKLEEVLGEELTAIKAGTFDASAYQDGFAWHFFHVSNLGAAMVQLKESLARRGLLDLTHLFHAESAAELREYYPATARVIADKEAEPTA